MTDTAIATAATGSVALPQKLCETVNYSMLTGMPLIVTYWDAKGKPQTSWRGSTHVHEDGRLAIWIRSRQGGLQSAIRSNPKLRLAYRNPNSKSFVLFEGRAVLEESEEGNRAIYDASPPMERKSDPDRKGVGVVVTVERVTGDLEGETIALR